MCLFKGHHSQSTSEIDAQTGSGPFFFFLLLSDQNIRVSSQSWKHGELMKWSITSDFGKMYQSFRTGFMVHLHMTSQLNKNIKPAITAGIKTHHMNLMIHLITRTMWPASPLHVLHSVLDNNYQPIIDDHADVVNVFLRWLLHDTVIRENQRPIDNRSFPMSH